MFTPPVVKYLLIINIAMLVLSWILPAIGIDMYKFFALYFFKSDLFRPHQLVTHMFMHANLTHLFFNMLMLWMFGRILESVWGSKRFFVYFFVTGLGAALLHTFVNYLQLSSMLEAANQFLNSPSPQLFREFVKEYINDPNAGIFDFLMRWEESPDSQSHIAHATQQVREYIGMRMDVPTVGASGAVYGVLLAFGMLFPNTELMLIFLPFYPIKAKYMIGMMIIVELMLGLSMPGSSIAHFAHLGGMLFGFLLIKYWNINSQNPHG